MDEAAVQYAAAVETGAAPADLTFEAGIVHSMADRTDEAFDYLQRAVDAGLRVELSTVDELQPLHGHARWSGLLERQHESHEQYRARYWNPAVVQFITDDIRRFACVFNEAAKLSSADARAAFAVGYFDMASPGLEAYALQKMPRDSVFAEFVNEHAGWFSGMGEVASAIDAQVPAMRRGLQRLQALYPEAVFADVYFVVGSFTSGGTTASPGLILGSELYGRVPGASLESAPADIELLSPAALPFVVLHELVHFLQPFYGGTLLKGALLEGGASFVAHLALGLEQETSEARLHEYGLRHERDIWHQFQEDMHGSDWSNWIANSGAVEPGEQHDLGYFVGYRIAQAHYERASDKGEAVRDLLKLEDPEAILRASGYAERFRD